MQEYQCHKRVKAFKIVGVRVHSNSYTLVGETGEEVDVPDNWGNNNPTASSFLGGYYVKYEDGYTSWSPAKAFEDGYTKV